MKPENVVCNDQFVMHNNGGLGRTALKLQFILQLGKSLFSLIVEAGRLVYDCLELVTGSSGILFGEMTCAF
jgi:hypothetical protein